MKLPKSSHPWVYKLTCSCTKANVGETGRKVSNEHSNNNNQFIMETGKSQVYQNMQNIAMKL